MDAFAKGDAEAVGALYTNDCKVMPTGSDVIEGQQGSYMYMYNLLFYLPGKAHYIHTLNFILLCGGWTMCVIIGTRMILVGFSSYLIFSLSIGAAKVFRSVMSAGAKKVLLTIDEVGPMGTGDTIYERSHYCFYKEDGSVFDQGKYVQTYQNLCL